MADLRLTAYESRNNRTLSEVISCALEANKNAFIDVVQFIKSLPVRRDDHPRDETDPVQKWVSWRLDCERELGVGTQAEQYEWFVFLLTLARDRQTGGTQSYGAFLLTHWAAKSSNMYAMPYHNSHIDGNTNGSFYATKRAKLKARKVMASDDRRAENGQRLIGATSRAMLSEAGKKGANTKHAPTRELKKWALAKAHNMRGGDKQIAKTLARTLPDHLKGASDDPARFIYDKLRASKKQ